MPRIPGVTAAGAQAQASDAPARSSPAARLVVALAVALALGIGIAWWTLRAPRHAATSPLTQPAAPAASPPAAPGGSPVAAPNAGKIPVVPAVGSLPVAMLQELAKPWSSKNFFFRKRMTDQNMPAMVIRLPGPAGRSSSYWGLSLRAPFGRCDLEYVTDLSKLATQYGYRASHPMVADPCTATVYDPLRVGTLVGGAWARGEVVQGSGIRPPIAIDIRVEGGHLVATQVE